VADGSSLRAMPEGGQRKKPEPAAGVAGELAAEVRELVAELKAAREAAGEREAGKPKGWSDADKRLFWVTSWATLVGALAAAMVIGYSIVVVRAYSSKGRRLPTWPFSEFLPLKMAYLISPIIIVGLIIALSAAAQLYFRANKTGMSQGSVRKFFLMLGLYFLIPYAAIAVLIALGILAGIH
jgi:hypothetical protein